MTREILTLKKEHEPDPFADVELEEVQDAAPDITFKRLSAQAIDPEVLPNGFVALFSRPGNNVGIKSGQWGNVFTDWLITAPEGYTLIVHILDAVDKDVIYESRTADDGECLAAFKILNRDPEPVTIWPGDRIALVELRKIQPVNIILE